MNRVVLLPYKMTSLSSKAIARHFGIKRIFPDRKFRPRHGDVIINWGYTSVPPVLINQHINFRIINHPDAVGISSNKLDTFVELSNAGVPVPDFFFNIEDAEEYMVETGNTIYCRTLLTSSKGNGIVLANTPDELVECKLYTAYFKNNKEFRVHVFNGNIIDFVQKKKMSKERMEEMNVNPDNTSKYIRNLMRGWSFCRKDVVLPEVVKNTSIEAVLALNLDFGAVDIAYNEEDDNCVVLEVNTAPGMRRGTTTHFNYVNAISKMLYNKEILPEEYCALYKCNILVDADENVNDNDEE